LFRIFLAHFKSKLSQKGQNNRIMSFLFYGKRIAGREEIGREGKAWTKYI
jgi:hypothetical protein